LPRDFFEDFDRESKRMFRRFGLAAVGVVALNLVLLAGAIVVIVLVLQAMGVL